MNHLHRPLAPISDAAWEEISGEATRELRHFLSGRRVVNLSGPHGWDHSCLDLGRVTDPHDGPADGVESRVRLVQPLTELRTPFTVSRAEVDAVEPGRPRRRLGSGDRRGPARGAGRGPAGLPGLPGRRGARDGRGRRPTRR